MNAMYVACFPSSKCFGATNRRFVSCLTRRKGHEDINESFENPIAAANQNIFNTNGFLHSALPSLATSNNRRCYAVSRTTMNPPLNHGAHALALEKRELERKLLVGVFIVKQAMSAHRQRAFASASCVGRPFAARRKKSWQSTKWKNAWTANYAWGGGGLPRWKSTYRDLVGAALLREMPLLQETPS